MAGDWIKMEACTPEKSEVLAITAAMGWEDCDMTVGKLFRIWRWFDQQTVDGNAPSVTKALLDRIVGVTGFCDAMASVDWLIIHEGGISLPNFENHNGATAKSRAQGVKRAAKLRGSDKSNAQTVTPSVTDALPREEKRREEKKEQKPCVPSAHDPAAGNELFDRFWKLYPRKQDKAKAAKAFAKLKVTDDLFSLIAKGLAAQAASHDWLKDNGKFVPMPTTWLNGRRWEDEVKPAGIVHAFPGQSRHTGFAERDYTAGLIEREDGTYAF